MSFSALCCELYTKYSFNELQALYLTHCVSLGGRARGLTDRKAKVAGGNKLCERGFISTLKGDTVIYN